VPNSGTDLLSVTPPGTCRPRKPGKNFSTEAFLGDRAHIEKGARKLNLADALSYAFPATGVTWVKKSWFISAPWTSPLPVNSSPPSLLAPAGTLDSKEVESGVNSFITESTLTTTAPSASALQRTGTRFAVDLTTDFVRFLTGDLRSVSDSSLAVTVAQPLLRGAGYLAASEVLTQAERDVLY
jgi:hypothetical protein